MRPMPEDSDLQINSSVLFVCLKETLEVSVQTLIESTSDLIRGMTSQLFK